MAQVFIAPNEPKTLEGRRKIKVFLAGGITGCGDWQSRVIDYLSKAPEIAKNDDILICSPRRDVSNDQIDPEEQIAWEYKWLNNADIVTFYFANSESVQPITLYELGRQLALHYDEELASIAVSVEKGYKRQIDIEYQMKNITSFTPTTLRNSLELNATPESHAEFIRRKIMIHQFINYYDVDWK